MNHLEETDRKDLILRRKGKLQVKNEVHNLIQDVEKAKK